MEVNKLVEEVKSQLTGNKLDDYHFIQNKMNEFAKSPETIEAARALTAVLLEIVNPEELNKIKESMKKGIASREMLFAKAETLLKSNKLENAKVVLDKIAYQIENLVEDDDVYHYINIEEPFAFQVYTNLVYKGPKIIRFAPDHLFKYHYLRGVVNMKLGLIDEAEEAYDKALRWFPNSFSVLLEKANVEIARKNLDKALEYFREAQKCCFVPKELARCYRGIGYYGLLVENYRLAMAGYLTSTIFDTSVDIKNELAIAAEKMGQKEFTPLPATEAKEEFKKINFPFGASVELIRMGVVLGNEFATQKNYPMAIYFLRVSYSLSMDQAIKDKIDELEKLAKNN